MLKEGLIKELETVKEFFERSTSCLTEEDSNFKPKDPMYTVSGHYAHTALSIDWFIDGMFNPKGFAANFEEDIKNAKACKSLSEAKDMFNKAISHAIKTLNDSNDEELKKPLAKDTIMQGPRFIVIGGISEHTAHHRGALTVYSRLLDKEPKMPYGDF